MTEKNITLTYETTRGNTKIIEGLKKHTRHTGSFYYTKGEGLAKIIYCIGNTVSAQGVLARQSRLVGYVIDFNDY